MALVDLLKIGPPSSGWRIEKLTTGDLIPRDVLGSGATGAGNLFLADDYTWKTAGGIGTTNLSLANQTDLTLDITSSTGTGVTIPEATTLLAGLLIVSDKTKLNNLSGINTGDQAFTASGDATAPSSTTNLALTLVTVNSNIGTFGSATQSSQFTVNAKGLITAASNVTITPPWSSITSTPTTLSGYGITDAQPLDADLTAIAALGFASLSFLKKTAANTWALDTNIYLTSSSGVSSTLTDTHILVGNSSNIATDVALSGDATLNNTGALTLASVITAGGPIGSATVTPIITYDAKGRLTTVSSATITPAASSITGGATLSKSDDTNVTLTLGGTLAIALLAATSLSLGWTGTLGVARGGTNIASYAVGDLLYASGATTLSKLADVAAGSYLRSGGVTTAPSWSTLTLPNTTAINTILYSSAANVISALATANSGVLVTDGSGVPSIGTTLPNIAIGTPTSGTLTNCTGLPAAGGGSDAWVDYSATSTITGWSAFTTKILSYKKIGTDCMLIIFYFQGTGSGTASSFTVPVTNSILTDAIGKGINNVTNVTSLIEITASTSTVNLYASSSGGAWTNATPRQCSGQIYIKY